MPDRLIVIIAFKLPVDHEVVHGLSIFASAAIVIITILTAAISGLSEEDSPGLATAIAALVGACSARCSDVPSPARG